jgi:hypothetical protein
MGAARDGPSAWALWAISAAGLGQATGPQAETWPIAAPFFQFRFLISIPEICLKFANS